MVFLLPAIGLGIGSQNSLAVFNRPLNRAMAPKEPNFIFAGNFPSVESDISGFSVENSSCFVKGGHGR